LSSVAVRFAWVVVAASLAATAAAPSLPAVGQDDEVDNGSFGLSPPVACKEIRGFEDFDPLPGAALTADEKLLVYVLPRHYKIRRVASKYQAHVTEDVRVRRRGEKTVIWSKKDMVDYPVKTEAPPGPIFMRNTISLKGLKPGEYDLDITVYDKVGRSTPAVRTMPFRVIAAPTPAKDAKDKGA
jgi:hypothetical protein